ncbi:MAG: Crp/Fnr family transcriptional regulator [Anaerolineae bacterium]|jgi:CRP/FNR family transcriptional regulator|nr:Crp/Fnr family transcriptional regulator [Anaerolineae bacterium]MCZ7552427.1 Crp/Fnr family transcriptional regulator [Anaerolineales bacterium]
MHNIAHELSQTPAFNCLPLSEVQELVKLGRVKALHKNEYICHQGDPWPYLIYVRKGLLRWAILSASGREHVLFLLEPKSIFWGHTLMDDQPMPASLMAMKQAEIMLWHKDVLHPFLNHNPEVLWGIIRYQAEIMRRAREIIYGLAFQPVAGRLAKLLLDRSGQLTEEPLKRDLTLNEIAAMVNTSQEVVCRLLYQFQTDGLLQVNRASIQLQDVPALQKLFEAERER